VGTDAVRKTLDVTTTSDPPRATIGPSPWTVQQRRHFDASVLNKQGEGHQNRTQQPIDRSRGASAVPAAATKATPSMIQQQQRSRPLPPSSVQWDSSATMPPNDDRGSNNNNQRSETTTNNVNTTSTITRRFMRNRHSLEPVCRIWNTVRNRHFPFPTDTTLSSSQRETIRRNGTSPAATRTKIVLLPP
jgi:histone deacetylase complex regulatory component SIN3